MFGLAERSNLHDNLMNSVKVVINPHRMLPMRTPLLTSFLSNGVESSVLMSFFNADFNDRVLNSLSIMIIDIDNDVKGRMAFNYNYKNCNHLINYLLSLMDLILKLGENVDILYR